MGTGSGRKKRERLSAEDWTAAALRTLVEDGLGSVAVEPLAAKLGVTKGSFYWHFKDRQALLEAALQRWTDVGTTDRFAQLDTEADPAERMRNLLGSILEDEGTLALDFAVQVSADDPVVAPFARRANHRWTAWLTDLYEQMGMPEPQAREWALLAYSTYIGFLRIIRSDPELAPRGKVRSDYVQFLDDALIPSRR